MNKQRHGFDMIATLCCVGFLVCWSTGSIQIKLLTDYVDIWTQNLTRYTIACLFWLPFLGWSLYHKRVPKRLWLIAIPVAVGNIIHQSLWAGAFYYADPGFVTLVTKTSIIWIAMFSIAFFAAERVLIKSPFFWFALMGSIAGLIGVIVFQSDVSFRASKMGVAICVGCSLAWAVYTIIAKMSLKNIDPRISFAIITIYSLIGITALAFWRGQPAQALQMDTMGWVHTVSSSITSIALAHVFYYVAMQRIGATIPAMIILAMPFLTILMSRWIFGETLTPAQWIFGTVLITGAAAAIWAQRDLQKSRQ